ncbi:hypothetical protein [Halodesulfovibrio marinisediminis]|uniref:Type III secretion system translocon protein, YopD/IpaC/EspB family n=1 Tax=Halodesulfovibrio marinisediminis DSM 17456 TaxID=1121457 RepID=A0A1N6I990_9BACT|nr:hypothetical protein [Halodesulfovibrio marinisediminis]SIO28586.1 type III secretion system translocon protein, YopD/IpaC/EspB family [Halodesulfovibrio marinisediminis DSM 17456]
MSVVDSVNSYVKQNYSEQSAQFNKEVSEFFKSYSSKTGKSAENLQSDALKLCRTKKLSFAEALEKVSNTKLPPLMKKHISGYETKNPLGLPAPTADASLPLVWGESLAAQISALTTKLADQQRVIAKETKLAMSKELAKNKLEQADKAQAAALAKAICGYVSGAISIGGGMATMGRSLKMQNPKVKGPDGKMIEDSSIIANNMKLDAQVKTISQVTSGVSPIVNSTGEIVGSHFEHQRATLDAEATKMQAEKDAVDSLMQSMNELRQKSMDTQRALMQANLDTQRRILA